MRRSCAGAPTAVRHLRRSATRAVWQFAPFGNWRFSAVCAPVALRSSGVSVDLVGVGSTIVRRPELHELALIETMQIIRPHDPTYDQVRTVFYGGIDKRP